MALPMEDDALALLLIENMRESGVIKAITAGCTCRITKPDLPQSRRLSGRSGLLFGAMSRGGSRSGGAKRTPTSRRCRQVLRHVCGSAASGPIVSAIEKIVITVTIAFCCDAFLSANLIRELPAGSGAGGSRILYLSSRSRSFSRSWIEHRDHAINAARRNAPRSGSVEYFKQALPSFTRRPRWQRNHVLRDSLIRFHHNGQCLSDGDTEMFQPRPRKQLAVTGWRSKIASFPGLPFVVVNMAKATKRRSRQTILLFAYHAVLR